MTANVQPRSLAQIVATLTDLRQRHADLLAVATSGELTGDQSAAFALAETELRLFDASCGGGRLMILMSGGFRWGDELRHPQAPDTVALVRLIDQVEIAGETMSLMQATKRYATASGPCGGPALGSWTSESLRVADAFSLEHPPRVTAVAETAVQSDAAANVAAGQNYSLF